MKKPFKLFHHNFEWKTSCVSVILFRQFFLPVKRFSFYCGFVLDNFWQISLTVFNVEVFCFSYLWGVK